MKLKMKIPYYTYLEYPYKQKIHTWWSWLMQEFLLPRMYNFMEEHTKKKILVAVLFSSRPLLKLISVASDLATELISLGKRFKKLIQPN